MALYQYKVRDQFGKASSGTIEAENRQLVIERLRQQGYMITSIEERIQGKDISEVISAIGGVNLKDLAIFSRQFATMISAGLSIVRALTVLEEQTVKPVLKQAISEIRLDVEAGNALSNAFQKHPKIFPEIFVTMIRAGEAGGILDVVMQRIADHFEKEYDLSQKIKAATRYPLAISIFALLVVSLMMGFVLPSFAKMFAEMKAELPMITRVLMGLSNMVREDIFVILIFTVAAVVGFKRWSKSDDSKSKLDRLLITLPIVGSLIQKISIARVCRTLGTLMSAGVHVINALEIVESVSGNSIIQKGLQEARDSIRKGDVISAPLKSTGVFPPMVIQMIAVGEETGNLDIMLSKVADFYEQEIEQITATLSSLIEPFLIVFLGILIGLMVFAIMLPMTSMFDVLSV